jgi:hypothetical protein
MLPSNWGGNMENQQWLTKLKAAPIRRLGNTTVRIAQVGPLAESVSLTPQLKRE